MAAALIWINGQLGRPYFKINHKPALAAAVMTIDINMDNATSFAHSQYDTRVVPVGNMPRGQYLGKYRQAKVQFVPNR